MDDQPFTPSGGTPKISQNLVQILRVMLETSKKSVPPQTSMLRHCMQVLQYLMKCHFKIPSIHTHVLVVEDDIFRCFQAHGKPD